MTLTGFFKHTSEIVLMVQTRLKKGTRRSTNGQVHNNSKTYIHFVCQQQ